MSALLNRGSILEELKLDASDASADAYVRVVRNVIERSILPRKISIQNSKGDYNIIVNQGDIVGIQEPEEKTLFWVQDPLSESKRNMLELSAASALKDGEISLSMISDLERAELAKRETPTGDTKASFPSAPPEIVSLSDWKQGKKGAEAKAIVENCSTIADFFASIKSKAKFVFMEDGGDGQVQMFGASGVVCEDVFAELKPSILTWRKSVLSSLGSAPQLITMRSPSGGGSLLVCAVDGRQYLLAELEAKNFGAVVSLWVKASQSK